MSCDAKELKRKTHMFIDNEPYSFMGEKSIKIALYHLETYLLPEIQIWRQCKLSHEHTQVYSSSLVGLAESSIKNTHGIALSRVQRHSRGDQGGTRCLELGAVNVEGSLSRKYRASVQNSCMRARKKIFQRCHHAKTFTGIKTQGCQWNLWYTYPVHLNCKTRL
jgi:hypothetical protein